ncbi:hypothetical protein [Ruminococcus sp.]|uniref:hypothetical protein n=1 Tax=Ruminococcus sp. TaxID=41978 RepID=UPI002B97DBBD|nr:hypothetical protein [Ruminococcus sp.]HOA00526.1 hypothetical protein [Ruminococcus sp.]HOH88492.1 hypothetical protein [Ruminococcus sp.]
MEDIMGRISELLSDEESVKQLSELAQMLVSEEGAENENTSEQPDLSSLMKLTSLVGAASNDTRNTDLLLALKPHLGADKQKRVDKAIKLMKLLAMWNIAKDSGLLQELI